MPPSLVSDAEFRRIEELTTCRFCVDIEGVAVAAFRECSGLNGEIQIETYQEGGLNEHEHKLPGRVKYGNLTLRGGTSSTVDLWEWFHTVSTGRVERKNVSVVMYLADAGEAMRWNLQAAYPVRWQGPEFTAGDPNVAIQTLELAHNGITLSRA